MPRENFFPPSWSFSGFIGGADSFYLATPLSSLTLSLSLSLPLSEAFSPPPVFPLSSFLRESDKTLAGPYKSSGCIGGSINREINFAIDMVESEHPYGTAKF
jgi:hypothetical protein